MRTLAVLAKDSSSFPSTRIRQFRVFNSREPHASDLPQNMNSYACTCIHIHKKQVSLALSKNKTKQKQKTGKEGGGSLRGCVPPITKRSKDQYRQEL